MAEAQTDLGRVEVVLASGSPRRRHLIERLGVSYQSVTPGVDEDGVAARVGTGDPVSLVTVLATTKLAHTLTQLGTEPGSDADRTSTADRETAAGSTPLVVAADTIVVRDGVVLGKPRDRAELHTMMASYSGATIEVLTAVAAGRPGQGPLVEVVTTQVTFGPISEAEVAQYVASGQGDDKAGGLSLQGGAGSFIERVDGCWTNVIGLPLCATRRLLVANGIAVEVCCQGRTGDQCPESPRP